MERQVIASQIRAALRMLRSTIETCPNDLWNRITDHNSFWVIAYHTLFYAHLYLSPTEDALVPYERTVEGHPAYGKSDLGDWATLSADDVYTKEDVLAYCDHIMSHAQEMVDAVPMDASSGFHWLKFSRAEAHLYNLRHIQHHAGQLIERLRQEAGLGTKWVLDGR